MSNSVASSLDIGLWLVEETTPGVRAEPTAASFISTTNQPDISQSRGKAQNQEKTGSLGKKAAVPMKYQAGSLKFNTYIKPTAAGTVPVGSLLYKSCFGDETVNAGTDVVYNLSGVDGSWNSMTAYIKRGHTVYTCVGAQVNSAKFTLNPSEGDDGLASAEWDLMFLKMLHTGTATGTTDGAASEIVFSTADDVRKYSVGSLVKIDTDDNTGAGYVVTGIDEDNLKITLNGTPSALTDKTVAPFLPAKSEPSGSTIASYKGVAQEKESAGSFADILLTQSSFSINHNLAAATNEKDGLDYPGLIIRGAARDVTLDAQALFYEDNTKYHAEAKDGVSREVQIPVGEEAGLMATFYAPNVSIEPPTESGDPQFVQQQSRVCYEVTNGNEELKLTFA